MGRRHATAAVPRRPGHDASTHALPGPHLPGPHLPGPGRDHPGTRARSAARHAERLYPGVLGRTVARELIAYAEAVPDGGDGLAESVVAEVLDRTPPRATG